MDIFLSFLMSVFQLTSRQYLKMLVALVPGIADGVFSLETVSPIGLTQMTRGER